ncbi:MAG: hypothetical protein JXQ26_07315 [Tissierellales bacterium]|nr:hypothetical protein [Tissierellales bacterium]MBN2827782.1 hypothetical protein [Tissierellales bacterium]
MSHEPNKRKEELEKYKSLTKLHTVDVLLIVGTTIFLILLYATLHLKIEWTVRYLLPYGYLAVVVVILRFFYTDIKEMNKKFD